MLSNRLASALRRQDGATVVIEFSLVLFGVLIALQVNNWNTARTNKLGAVNALERLRSEIVINIAALDDRMTAIEASYDVRRKGLIAIEDCDVSPEGAAAISDAINNLTGDIIPALIDNSLRELARQDRYLDFLTNDFRADLSVYSGRLADERDQLKINFALMWDQHVTTHPMVGLELTDGDIFNRLSRQAFR